MATEVPQNLGDGWVLYHAQDPQAVKASGLGADVITVKDGHFVAHKRVGGALYEQQGSSLDELKERIKYWENTQVVPNPATEDGNRELTPDEKLESAKATVMQHVTIGARPGAEVDLTPAPSQAKPAGAIIQAHPHVNVQKVTGEQAASIAAAASGAPLEAAPASTPAESPTGKTASSKSSSSKSKSGKSSKK